MPKTYTSVPNVTTLSTYPSATYNTYTAQNINNLIVPPACKVYNSAAQSIGNAAWVLLTFDSEVYDTDGMHDTVTNTGRITIQTPGMYQLYGTVGLNTTSTVGTARILVLQKNGATGSSGIAMAAMRIPPAQYAYLTVSVIDNAQASDYYSLYVYQDTGGSVNTLSTTWTVSGGYVTAASSFDPAQQNFGATWIGRTS